MSNAVIPNLPPLSSIEDKNVRVALEQMWNAWRVRNGDVGDGTHKFLTEADLKDAINATEIVSGSGGTTSTPTSTGTTSWVKPLISKIDDYIAQSWLWKKLGERIELIENPDWFRNNFEETYGTGIKNEEIIRKTADEALSKQISTVSSSMGQNIAAVRTQITTVATNQEALTNYTTTQISSVNSNIALLQNSYTTLANQSGATASSVSQLQTTVNGVSNVAQVALTAAQTAEGKVNNSWTVKFDYNGYVVGAGLGLEAKNGSVSSQFYVRADVFAVGNPSYPGGSPIIPFKVITGVTFMNGQVIYPGVYMNEAMIANGTIDNAKIGDAQITTAKIGVASIDTLRVAGMAVSQSMFSRIDGVDQTFYFTIYGNPGDLYDTYILGEWVQGWYGTSYLWVNGGLVRLERPRDGTLGVMVYKTTLWPGNHAVRLASDNGNNIGSNSIFVLVSKR